MTLSLSSVSEGDDGTFKGHSKASSVTGDIGSLFFIFPFSFPFRKLSGQYSHVWLSLLHPPQQLRGIRHALCALKAAGKHSFLKIFLMETKQGFA